MPIAPWVALAAIAAVPLPVAWLWLRLLGATGVIEAPDGPVLPRPFPLETSGIVAMVLGGAGRRARVLARALAPALRARRALAAAANGAPRRARPGVEGSPSRPGCGSAALAAIAWA